MSETGAMAGPDWLAGLDDRAKLAAIMAAVRRCYAECSEPRLEPTGPHISVTMAEKFLAQMMSGDAARGSSNAEGARVVTLKRPEPRDILVIGPHGEELVSVILCGDRASPGVLLSAGAVRLFGDEPLRVALALVDTMAEAQARRPGGEAA